MANPNLSKENLAKILVDILPEPGQPMSSTQRMKYVAVVTATLEYYYPTRGGRGND